MFEDRTAIGINLSREPEGTLQLLLTTLSNSRTSAKSTYALWIWYFTGGERNQVGRMIKRVVALEGMSSAH